MDFFNASQSIPPRPWSRYRCSLWDQDHVQSWTSLALCSVEQRRLHKATLPSRGAKTTKDKAKELWASQRKTTLLPPSWLLLVWLRIHREGPRSQVRLFHCLKQSVRRQCGFQLLIVLIGWLICSMFPLDSEELECAHQPKQPHALPSAVESGTGIGQVPSSLATAHQPRGHPEFCQEAAGKQEVSAGSLALLQFLLQPSPRLMPLMSGWHKQRAGRLWSKGLWRDRLKETFEVGWLVLCEQESIARWVAFESEDNVPGRSMKTVLVMKLLWPRSVAQLCCLWETFCSLTFPNLPGLHTQRGRPYSRSITGVASTELLRTPIPGLSGYSGLAEASSLFLQQNELESGND
jgi:hypothetical protein